MKHFLYVLLACAIVACGAETNDQATTANIAVTDSAETDSTTDEATDTPEPTPLPDVEPTAESPTTSAETEPSAGPAEADSDADAIQLNDEVADEQPGTNPIETMVLRPSDQFKGASDPAVVLVEYGDFQ